MKAALVASWTQPIPGREQKALEYGSEVNMFWGRRAKEGKCTEPEVFLCEHGANMWMVKGEQETLAELSQSEEAQLLIMKGDLLLKDFAFDVYHTGDAAEHLMGTYSKALHAIG